MLKNKESRNENLFKQDIIDLTKFDGDDIRSENESTMANKDNENTDLIKVQKQIENLVNFIAENIAVEVTKKRLENLEKEKETLEKEISDIKSKNEKNINKLDILKNLKSTWFNMTFDEQRLIIEHIVDKVIVTNNNIDIKLKIS